MYTALVLSSAILGWAQNSKTITNPFSNSNFNKLVNRDSDPDGYDSNENIDQGLFEVTRLPSTYNAITMKSYSGYYSVRNERTEEYAHIFGWFFPSQNDSSVNPLVLHLGGCAGEQAVFWEHGPYRINSNGVPENNPYSWNLNHSVMYVDSPFGQGFSPAPGSHSHVINEHEVASILFQFMLSFYEQFPAYQNVPLYIHGSAEAGHYASVLGAYVLQHNDRTNFKKLRVGGVLIGNGMVNPQLQFEAERFAVANGLVQEGSTADALLVKLYNDCYRALVLEDWSYAATVCNMIVPQVVGDVPKSSGRPLSPYNINQYCYQGGDMPCYNTSEVNKYLNNEQVQMALHVARFQTWQACNARSTAGLTIDQLRDLSATVVILLARRVPVIVYSGMLDLQTNWKSTLEMVNAIVWEGQNDFSDMALKYWNTKAYTQGTAGHYKSQQGFTFMALENAGHYVARDQPAMIQAMLQQFTNGVFGLAREMPSAKQPTKK